MFILTIRTDKPEAEIGLYEGNTQIAYETWQAHRQLAETIHTKIRELLEGQNMSIHNIGGLALYKGPGSFTGLRIGASVADALAYSLNAPIVSVSGDGWQTEGVKRLLSGEDDKIVQLEYGAPVHITAQKK
jgi:tRNA threonylcarbamoyladenosine biosynthesis protein TsaB